MYSDLCGSVWQVFCMKGTDAHPPGCRSATSSSCEADLWTQKRPTLNAEVRWIPAALGSVAGLGLAAVPERRHQSLVSQPPEQPSGRQQHSRIWSGLGLQYSTHQTLTAFIRNVY